MTIQSIEEVLSSIRNERELEAVGGAGAPSALRMRRIRILEKITAKPFAYIERTTQPSTAKCSRVTIVLKFFQNVPTRKIVLLDMLRRHLEKQEYPLRKIYLALLVRTVVV